MFFFLPSAITVTGPLATSSRRKAACIFGPKRAFGDRHAFLCGWFYFISTVLYFPSSAACGNRHDGLRIRGLRSSALLRTAHSRYPLTLVVLWAAFAANFFGMKVAKWISALGGSSTFIIGAVLGAIAILVGVPLRCGHKVPLVAGGQLGHGEFLVTDCLCIYRTRTGADR